MNIDTLRQEIADDVVTDDDHGKYYERQTIVESGLSNYV